MKQDRRYLCFMLIACTGAFAWQMLFPSLAQEGTAWGVSGWQREIALWNVGLMAAILCALLKKDGRMMRALVLQSTVLCWLLGINHLAAMVSNASCWPIHLLGVVEVLVVGGVWGAVLLLKKPKEKPLYAAGIITQIGCRTHRRRLVLPKPTSASTKPKLPATPNANWVQAQPAANWVRV